MTTYIARSPNPVALPELDFTAQAVIDWVSFVVRLNRTSHGGHLKRLLEALGVSKVMPLDVGPGGAATQFRIDLQHPARHGIIKGVIDTLDASHGVVGECVLTGMEISIDFWPKSQQVAELPKLTERLMTSITPPVINNPRFADRENSITLPDRKGKIDPEMTLYIGNQSEDLLWRVYWKRTDETFVGEEGKRLPKPLPESEWRARAEVRVQGSALAALSLAKPSDLANFSFERLHALGYFKFCRKLDGIPVLASNAWASTAAKSLGVGDDSPACVLGMFGQRDKRYRPLKLSRYLETDMELTEAVRHALRGLTRRF